MSTIGKERRLRLRRVRFRSSKRRLLSSAILFSVIGVYLSSIVLKESVEGHISTSRSWFAAVVIGGLALLAAWRAARSWRQLAATRRFSRDQPD